MLKISEIYQDAVIDDANKDQNGDISFPKFNRYSKRAELKFIDWLTGKIDVDVPQMYQRQKTRDLLSPFIVKLPSQVVDGVIIRPEDYYTFENAYLLGSFNKVDNCDEEIVPEIVGCNTPIELLSNSQFYFRCNTFIEGLQPSFEKPIVKEVGNTFEFLPKDLGSFVLEYIKIPVFGEIKVKKDDVYNDEVPDEDTSINYEWTEAARNLLTWFIVQQFSISTREKSLFEVNAASKP